MSDDWVLVPREPTPEMLKAGAMSLFDAQDEIMRASLSGNIHDVGRTKMAIRYRAMLAAAPEPPRLMGGLL